MAGLQNKKRIAIVTWFNSGRNYGQTLQAFALSSFLRGSGYDTEVLSYGMGDPFRLDKLNRIYKYFDLNRDSRVLQRRFDYFVDKYIPHSKPLLNKNQVEKYLCKNRFDVVICGSDQIWNPYCFDPVYYLDLDVSIKKIAYAVSLVNPLYIDKYDEYIEIDKLIQSIDSVSVRENTAVDIIRNIAGINSDVVLDPTLLMSSYEWDKALNLHKKCKSEYAFVYMFSLSKDQAYTIKKYCKLIGIKNIICSDILMDGYRIGNVIKDMGVRSFVNTIKNARVVFTDSYHGTAFSIIYRKQFFVFNNDGSINDDKFYNFDRMNTLLANLDVRNRVVDTVIPNDTVDINYDSVYDLLDEHIKRSKSYLINSVENNPITIDKEDCIGCGACYNTCPKQSIIMKKDKYGFLYPSVDGSKCINCNKCMDSCPIKRSDKSVLKKDKKYNLYYDTHIDKRVQATSGGAFGVIAEYVIRNGGVVFGASFDDNYDVIIDYVTDKSDIHRLKKSKYVQASIGSRYSKVKEFLDEFKLVLYTGTPCQIAGLNSFLGRDYDNLYTVDIICHGVPSPDIYKLWLSELERRADSHIKSIDFRYKEYDIGGWGKSLICISFENGKNYRSNYYDDPYMYAFLENYTLRESCYDCNYKDEEYCGDITLGDFWEYEKYFGDIDDFGISAVVVNTNKGDSLMEILKDSGACIEATKEQLVYGNPSYKSSVKVPKNKNKYLTQTRKMNNWFNESMNINKKSHHVRPILGRIKRKLFNDRLNLFF